jgi:hypothetical protein
VNAGAKALACQGADGAWHRNGSADWLPTLFTLLLLRSTGVDPANPAVESAMTRLKAGFRWHEEFGHQPFFEGEVEPCINGGTLALGPYFGHPSTSLAQRLIAEQLDDGGWNCEAPKSARSSFHTTICVLEGLLEYEQAAGADPQVASARYHYDILRALDYLRLAGIHSDARIRDAIQIVKGARQADGRWLLDHSYDEALAFPFAESAGDPSRWNTLRALRVLRWHEQTQSKSATG